MVDGVNNVLKLGKIKKSTNLISKYILFIYWINKEDIFPSYLNIVEVFIVNPICHMVFLIWDTKCLTLSSSSICWNLINKIRVIPFLLGKKAEK